MPINSPKHENSKFVTFNAGLPYSTVHWVRAWMFAVCYYIICLDNSINLLFNSLRYQNVWWYTPNDTTQLDICRINNPKCKRCKNLGRLKDDLNTGLFKFQMDVLPLELLDAVLEYSFLYWILNSSPQQRDKDIIKALALVDFCWFQRITRRRFKRRIWQRLKGRLVSYFC